MNVCTPQNPAEVANFPLNRRFLTEVNNPGLCQNMRDLNG